MFIPILGCYGSVIDVIRNYRLRSKHEAAKEVDIYDKRGFIQLNELPYGYKGTRLSFLKAALWSMHGSVYTFLFANLARSERITRLEHQKL